MGRHTKDGEVNGVRREAQRQNVTSRTLLAQTIVENSGESGVRQKQTHNRKGRGEHEIPLEHGGAAQNLLSI